MFVQSAFGRVQKTGDKVICCSDPQMQFLRPAGLVQDLSHVGFGERAKRFALVIDDLKVRLCGGSAERDCGLTLRAWRATHLREQVTYVGEETGPGKPYPRTPLTPVQVTDPLS